MRLKVWGNLFRREKISAKTQGMKKRNHKIFGVFQNLEKKFLKYISSQKKKKSGTKYISRNFIPDFGKPQKFHDFIFISPEFGREKSLAKFSFSFFPQNV